MREPPVHRREDPIDLREPEQPGRERGWLFSIGTLAVGLGSIFFYGSAETWMRIVGTLLIAADGAIYLARKLRERHTSVVATWPE